MKNNCKYISQYAILIVISFCSIYLMACQKFLNAKSDKTLVELKTLDDLQAMLDNDINMNRGVSPGFGEASSDDYFLTNDRFSSLGDLDNKIYTWRVKEYNYPSDWAFAYNGIYVANYVLDHLTDIPINPKNEAQYRNIRGIAHFYKSFFYLSLIWDYGKAYNITTSNSDPGIVLRHNSDPSIKSTRSTVAQSYIAIIDEAKNAINLLEENQLIVLRPSKPAALGLLARAYLSMREYDSSYKYADLCLRLKSELVDFNDPDLNITARPVFRTFNKEILFYASQSLNHQTKNPSRAAIDTLLYSSYGSNDLRKQAYFFLRSGYPAFKGTYSHLGYTQLFSGIAVDEIYLIRSESALKKDQPLIEQAVNDLNKLLKNRMDGTFISYTGLTREEAISLVQKERRKELVMRGLRWSDIKRLNLENANIVLVRKTSSGEFTLQPNDSGFALPLPFDIVSMTGIQQN